jgi:hypothetical protein
MIKIRTKESRSAKGQEEVGTAPRRLSVNKVSPSWEVTCATFGSPPMFSKEIWRSPCRTLLVDSIDALDENQPGLRHV